MPVLMEFETSAGMAALYCPERTGPSIGTIASMQRDGE
jgi:hypothetical protein